MGTFYLNFSDIHPSTPASFTVEMVGPYTKEVNTGDLLLCLYPVTEECYVTLQATLAPITVTTEADNSNAGHLLYCQWISGPC